MTKKRPIISAAQDQAGSTIQKTRADSTTQGGCYEIKVEGHLDKQWSEWMGGLAITHEAGGYTLLNGKIRDQAALHGILVQIRDLGLFLISINRIEINEDGSQEV